MIGKSIDAITKPDIDLLLTTALAQGRTLDYKLTLPGGADDETREFLADVSSFANAMGGDIVYGIAEAKGVPTDILG
jgi:predicted HTH transcriptional regulator